MVAPFQPLDQRFPRRATNWRLRSQILRLPNCPLLMGIVNVTPDSFSDGGRFFDANSAVERGLALAGSGADLIDVGGESTRPYSAPVAVDEELRRVIPVIQALVERGAPPISIDTTKATVAREAVAAGAEIINDISALRADPQMLAVALETKAGVCAMHMQGSPQTMQDNPSYRDVVEDIYSWLARRRDELLAAGVAPDSLCLDPGVGFGKTHQHNITLLAGCYRFHELGCPLLVGASRKAFIGRLLGDKQADRTAGTIGVTLSLAAQGVQIVRVHDICPSRQALRLFEATGGIDGVAGVVE